MKTFAVFVGCGLVVGGLAMLSVPVALIAAGVALVAEAHSS